MYWWPSISCRVPFALSASDRYTYFRLRALDILRTALEAERSTGDHHQLSPHLAVGCSTDTTWGSGVCKAKLCNPGGVRGSDDTSRVARRRHANS